MERVREVETDIEDSKGRSRGEHDPILSNLKKLMKIIFNNKIASCKEDTDIDLLPPLYSPSSPHTQ